MPDNSLFVAGLTSVTAIVASSLASWLTSRGNASAARIQVDAATAAQRRDGIREKRRAAYLEFIERAQAIEGGLDGVVVSPEPASALVALRERRQELRRAATLIALEGPPAVVVAATNVVTMSGILVTAFAAVVENASRENRMEFQETRRAYLLLINPFIDAAAGALE
ncbi:hypothetical protein AB0I51_05865 [Streptomyces sp. NPDC050549]|uniref:hypothetical protein n=1 Tax=Streptomyces sp. NPDC050549 TaxID=3155406 RepID=UPI003421AB5C